MGIGIAQDDFVLHDSRFLSLSLAAVQLSRPGVVITPLVEEKRTWLVAFGRFTGFLICDACLSLLR